MRRRWPPASSSKEAPMKNHSVSIGAALACAIALSCGSAHALTMKECGVKYKAAKDAGTLNGQKWSDFRKAECGPDAAPAAAATPAAAPAATPAATGSAVFPSAISSKYSNESPGRGRMHTCRD